MAEAALTKTSAPIRVTTGVLKWVLLLVYLLIALFPLLWLTVSAFKTNFEIETAPFSLPAVWQFQNFASAISVSGLPQFFVNSIIVASLATAFNLFVTSLASFTIARETFPGRKMIFTTITAGVLIPIVALMVPYYTLIVNLGIYDRLLALIVTYAAINIPISTFLISSFMTSIPRELEDSAEIDGCNFFQRYSRIIMPLARPDWSPPERSVSSTAGTSLSTRCFSPRHGALERFNSRSGFSRVNSAPITRVCSPRSF
jgi:raffinose/stachyose/melibiose transport system permease protein